METNPHVSLLTGVNAHDAAIPEGRPASAADRSAITALVERYYAAARTDNGALACSLLYLPLASSVVTDYGRAPDRPELHGTTCSGVLARFFRGIPGQPHSSLAETKVTDVRLSRNGGFALLTSKAIPHGEMSVIREKGAWRVERLIGRERP